ncbi:MULTISPECIES: hypothetical protein [Streptomyces]|uniref:hypothetical protein n=1 Tax=Streptomyces herbicida TaxID=3065675 RepID=UPI0038CD7F46
MTTQTRVLQVCLRRRTTKGRHPDVLVAQRRERFRFRSGKRIRWGGRPLPAETWPNWSTYVVKALLVLSDYFGLGACYGWSR